MPVSNLQSLTLGVRTDHPTFRFLAGFFGSSSLTTTPAIISDVSLSKELHAFDADQICPSQLFNPADRGLVMSFFAVAGFGGPVVGPVAGNWLLNQGASWRWLFWLLLIFAGVSYCVGKSCGWIEGKHIGDASYAFVGLLVPETYAPVRIRHHAARLTKSTGRVHRSIQDLASNLSLGAKIGASLQRPFELLFGEPIIAFFCVYSGFICESA